MALSFRVHVYCSCILHLLYVQNGLNALHLASKEGHINIVMELIDRGAFVDAATKVRCYVDVHLHIQFRYQ